MKLVEKVQKGIEEIIINKEYDESRFLPSEGELCKRFDVSRATVREAVRAMEVRGFVKRLHGKGIVVVDNSVNVLTRTLSDVISRGDGTIVDLIEVRNIIETETVRMTAARAQEKDIRKMEQYLIRMEQAEEMDEEYYSSDLAFHLTMVEASGNVLLYAIYKSFEPLLRDVVMASSQQETCIERRYGFHRSIFDAIVKKDADAAVEAVKRHLKATYNYVQKNRL